MADYNKGYSTNVQSVVIQQQPISMYPQNARAWESGICGCFEDCGICCCVLWCPCVEMCKVATGLDENYSCCLCYSACITYGSSPCLAPLRTKTRVAMGIRGDVCMDYCMASCCPHLVFCQISRQLKAMGLR